MELSDLQVFQAIYDAEFWDHDEGFDTIEHVFSHIGKLNGKLNGKLATYVEAMQHPNRAQDPSKETLLTEIIPDLLANALRLVNNENASGAMLTLEDLFVARTEQLRADFSSQRPPNIPRLHNS